MTTELAKQVVGRTMEMADEFAAALEDYLKGKPWDAVEPTDDEFAIWFEDMAEGDPNFIPALDLCKGGPELNARYIKLMGEASWQMLVEPYLQLTAGEL